MPIYCILISNYHNDKCKCVGSDLTGTTLACHRSRWMLIVLDASYYGNVDLPRVLSYLYFVEPTLLYEYCIIILHPLLRSLCAYPIDVKIYLSHNVFTFLIWYVRLFFFPWLYVVWTCRSNSKIFIRLYGFFVIFYY